ncbi:phage virion morphogenesis protein [Paenibacillus planticolens]|uniref:Phage virion morphogenesis protein n=1 Tax=Paenibacillus planticolens TaxID=2654976 RepID=A0ABX1ZMN6_9BACL|nr:phage virion morphogenesis protein [Paenibacillus planticolens]NOV01349.1 hypothetical protein [Paenibacillus planticolens]
MSDDRSIDIKVDVSEVVKAMEAMGRRSLNLRPFFGAVGTILIKSAHENFDHQGRPAKWKGWAPLTKQIYEQGAIDSAMKSHKTKAGQNRQIIRNLGALGTRKILQNSGELRKSIVQGRLTASEVEVGSSLIYARLHQLGGSIVPKKKRALFIPIGGGQYKILKRVKVPARPFLVLQQTDVQVILRMAKDYVTRGEIG